MQLARTRAILLLSLFCAVVRAQVPGANVNMVSGTKWPTGDPYLQRQNEPSIAVSTRNPLHLFAGANDYRTVDVPFPSDNGDETGDAWLGIFKSFDGGQTWVSNLIPGYPQDSSPAGLSSPLRAFNVATDPTVRAGTHGLFYYSGLAFNRGTKAASGVFVSLFQDLNNKGNGDPISYVSTSMVATGTSGQFNDKPAMAVDIPRPNTPVGAAACTINGAAITTGKVYVAYTDFTGNQANNPHSRLFLAASSDCGATWSSLTKITEGDYLSQSPVIALDPGTGALYVAWRQLITKDVPDALMYAMSTDGGQSFSTAAPIFTFAVGQVFDQGSTGGAFRTLALPAITVDATSRVYVAWSERGLGPNGDARIVISTLAAGSTTWTAPYVADPTASGRGHQFLPALSYAYGRIALVFYDQREDATGGILQCPQGKICKTTADFVEVRVPQGDLAAGHPEKVFTTYIDDTGLLRRHTIDVRAAMVDPTQFAGGAALPFNSVRLSQYRYGSRPGSKTIEQLQFNPPNFPMFVHGTRPFIGDYIDVGGLVFVLDPSGKWVYNTQTSNAAVFHGVWTDNRDVRPPPIVKGVQDWSQYTPVASTGGTSLYDPTQQRPVCVAGQTGSKNQNVYTARISQGLFVGFKENAKQLVTPSGTALPRVYSIFIQNNTFNTVYYRLTINTPLPANTTASFAFALPLVPSLDVTLPPRSSASRSLFVMSTNSRASVTITATQIYGVGGSVIPPASGGLQSSAATNPDITNPDITNPDITNPDITNPDITNPDITNPDITTAEVYNPTVTNPDITNPDITNPDITNPDITNPDITNPDITNPDITNVVVTNPDITNPDITNPDITNPDITNPDITNPDITNLSAGTGGATDLTWRITNKGNTSSSYNAKLFLKQTNLCCPAGCSPGAPNCPQTCYKCQLIVRRTYTTPVAVPNSCTLSVEVQNIPVTNVTSPTFAQPSNAGNSDNSSDGSNATISLGPGQAGRVTVRVIGLTTTTLPPNTIKPDTVAGAPNTGQTAPAAALLVNTTQLPVVVAGAPYSATMQSVGGTGPARTWSLYQGSLPASLGLNTATGQVSSGGSNVSAAPGAYDVTFQVQDSPPPPTLPQLDRGPIEFQVNQFTITAVSAYKASPGSTILKGGDTATVKVTVANAGPATASTVTAPITVAQPTGTAAANCTLTSPPLPVSIPGNQTQVFTYACVVSGDGNLTFQAQAGAQYVNTVASVPANAAAVSSNSILVDSTPPTLTVTALLNGNPATPYTAGWTNQSVTITFACVDNPPPSAPGVVTSGVAAGNPTGSTTLSADTGGTNVPGNCADNAGNSAATLVFGPVMIDKTPPVITASATLAGGVAYTAGAWTNKSVVIGFTCADTLSGVAMNTVAGTTVTTQGANQSVTNTGTCTDKAGNTAVPAAFQRIDIDLTPPSIVITSPTNGAAYTVNAQVASGYGCADSLSGLASCNGPVPSGANIDTSSAGAKTFTVTATDVAGNVSQTVVNYTVQAAQSGINYPDFSSVAGLTFNGNTQQSGNVLRLTSAFGQDSSAWYAHKQPLANGFSSTFKFRISPVVSGEEVADGFAFVIQNSSANAIGTSGMGGYLGYQNIPDSLAIEFDTYQNSGPGFNDPNANHVAIQSNGTSANSVDHGSSAKLAIGTPAITLADGNIHTVNVVYVPGTLTVSIDNQQVLSASVNLATKLSLDSGSTAYVGFTGATGSLREYGDILSWTLTPTM